MAAQHNQQKESSKFPSEIYYHAGDEEGILDTNDQVDESSVSGDMLVRQNTNIREPELLDDSISDAIELEMWKDYDNDLKDRNDEESLYNADDDSTAKELNSDTTTNLDDEEVETGLSAQDIDVDAADPLDSLIDLDDSDPADSGVT
jgi:hypothetical protein